VEVYHHKPYSNLHKRAQVLELHYIPASASASGTVAEGVDRTATQKPELVYRNLEDMDILDLEEGDQSQRLGDRGYSS